MTTTKPATIIYTAVFGDYDYLPSPRVVPGDFDLICFTDNASSVREPWNAVHVPDDGCSPTVRNRRLKILGHPLLENYSRSMYIDGSVALRQSPKLLIDRALADKPMAVFSHSKRTSLLDELAACVDQGKISRESSDEYVAHLSQIGIPAHPGLGENYVVIRRHHDAQVKRFCEAWWRAFEQGPPRDQLHLPVVAWQQGFPVNYLDRKAYDFDAYLRIFPHRRRGRWLRRAFTALLARSYASTLGRRLEQADSSYRIAQQAVGHFRLAMHRAGPHGVDR